MGDTHLRPQTWNNRPDIVGDAYHSFDQIISYCLANKRALILAGDVFNTAHPDSQTIGKFVTGIQKLNAVGLKVYAIQGQHDKAVPPWPTALGIDCIEYVHGKVFTPFTCGTKFYAIDQQNSRDKVQAELKSVPADVEVLVMHQLFQEAFPLGNVWDAAGEWIPESIHHLFIGDLHQSIEFNIKGGKAWYTGSSYVCKLDEPKEKSFLDITYDGKINVTRIPLQTRPFVITAVNSEADLDSLIELIKTMPETVPATVLVVDYLATVTGVAFKLQQAVGKKDARLWLRPRTARLEMTVDSSVAATDTNNTLEAYVGKFIPAATEPYSFVMDLLKHQTCDVLAAWRAKIGVTL